MQRSTTKLNSAGRSKPKRLDDERLDLHQAVEEARRARRTIQVEALTDAMIERLRDELHLGRKDDVLRKALFLLDVAREANARGCSLAIVPHDFRHELAQPLIFNLL